MEVDPSEFAVISVANSLRTKASVLSLVSLSLSASSSIDLPNQLDSFAGESSFFLCLASV